MADGKIDVLKPGMRVRCKSYQTAGTFEGVVVKTECVDKVLVKVDFVNGAPMAYPFDRWTSFEGEVEDWG